MGFTYRQSNECDKQAVENLLVNTFGEYNILDYTDSIDGRYMLAFDNDRLIAITGANILFDRYNGIEIDWTTCIEEYRHKGLIVGMIQMLLSCIDSDVDVYCSCWRTEKDGNIHLKYAMDTLGFKEVDRGTHHYMSIYSTCMKCPYKRDNCECWEDLYLRKAVK